MLAKTFPGMEMTKGIKKFCNIDTGRYFCDCRSARITGSPARTTGKHENKSYKAFFDVIYVKNRRNLRRNLRNLRRNLRNLRRNYCNS